MSGRVGSAAISSNESMPVLLKDSGRDGRISDGGE
jgi:hypothetical protein